jgi:hypothetical protein
MNGGAAGQYFSAGIRSISALRWNNGAQSRKVPENGVVKRRGVVEAGTDGESKAAFGIRPLLLEPACRLRTVRPLVHLAVNLAARRPRLPLSLFIDFLGRIVCGIVNSESIPLSRPRDQ